MSLPEPAEIVLKVYELVSGTVEDARDWATVRTLFCPSARLRSVRYDGDRPVLRDLGLDGWIDAATQRFLVADFYERGTIDLETRTGAIATIISPYQASRSLGGPGFETGVNHFSFLRTDDHWQIVQILWEAWPAEHAEHQVKTDGPFEPVSASRA